MKGLRSIFSRRNVCLPLVNLQGSHVRKYRLFRIYLAHNHAALKSMAELEQRHYGGWPSTLSSARGIYERLLEAAFGAVHSLELLAGKPYPALLRTLGELDETVSGELRPEYAPAAEDLVLQLERVTAAMKGIVGAKACNLAAIGNELGLAVPPGFAITAHCFRRFMEEGDLLRPVEEILCGISPNSPDEIEAADRAIRAMILSAKAPGEIQAELLTAYRVLEEKTFPGVPVAMRSSAIGEDTEATFAGQYATVLNVTGNGLIDAYKTVIASKYSARAISYRLRYGLTDAETPMAVACVAMVEPRSSGVMYTDTVISGGEGLLKINSLWGLGEQLVSGDASPDAFLVDKKGMKILGKDICRKEQRLESRPGGGVEACEVAEGMQQAPSLDDGDVLRLARYGLQLEDFFGSPQDVEWALDGKGGLFILQSRPLGQVDASSVEQRPPANLEGHQTLLSGGEMASPGIATGRIFIVGDEIDLKGIPRDAVIVARTASPRYARLLGEIRGIITDIGSVTSHLASVAREFGIPAIVNAKTATSLLLHGEVVTMSASEVTVYQGIVESLAGEARTARNPLFESPMHRRMRAVLDRISPLNLTDPLHPSFSPEGCRTFHDIIRFTHEQAVKAMFGIVDDAEEVRSIQLTAKIPLIVRLIDLGGGLREGLTTCHVVTPDDIESVPLRAVWKGFTHPGITWEGGIAPDMRNLITLFAASAASATGEPAGVVSYGILAKDYMNLSVKFGYHFATIDALCGGNVDQNYASLQFSGGAGNYYGKTLRVSFLGAVLRRLGFQVSLSGDLLEAGISRYDRESMEQMLDQMGRLLASSRLLDMVISNQDDIQALTNAFFREDYDFLAKKREDEPKDFYTHGGSWRRVTEDGRVRCLQDGSKEGFQISSGLAGLMGKFVGSALQDFLDNIEAYYYFPLAIARDSELLDGKIHARVMARRGHIDRAGGIAFGIRNVSNYFVLRINALEDNVILFEYVNDKRVQRASVQRVIESNRWYDLGVEISGKTIRGFLDGEPVIEYQSGEAVRGLVGLWTKADSVTLFDGLTIASSAGVRTPEF